MITETKIVVETTAVRTGLVVLFYAQDHNWNNVPLCVILGCFS
jgi:hypothetical protein